MNITEHKLIFCYICASDHHYYPTCSHFICLNCYKKGNCLLCNDRTFREKSEFQLLNRKSIKRKFNEFMKENPEIFEEYSLKNDKKQIPVKITKVIDHMIRDFDLLDYSLLNIDFNNNVEEDYFEKNSLPQLKRNKLF